MDNTQPDVTNAEIVKKFGNMFLVEVNGTLRRVPATHKNELLYEHELYELLNPAHADERVVLRKSTDQTELIAVAPTESDSVYELWVGAGQPVVNPPDKAEELLLGVRNAVETPSDYTHLEQTYSELEANRVRKSVIARTASAFPHSKVVPRDRGWSILGVFLLTWDARIFLNTADASKTSFRISGDGVTETDQIREFLQIELNEAQTDEFAGQAVQVRVPPTQTQGPPRPASRDGVEKSCPSCESERASVRDEPTHEKTVYACTSCDEQWKEHYLGEKEVEFLGKAHWLLNHREQYEDETFWNVIESYVWHNGA